MSEQNALERIFEKPYFLYLLPVLILSYARTTVKHNNYSPK